MKVPGQQAAQVVKNKSKLLNGISGRRASATAVTSGLHTGLGTTLTHGFTGGCEPPADTIGDSV